METANYRTADMQPIQNFIRSYLFAICNLLYTEQIVTAVCRQFNTDRRIAENVLVSMQRNGWLVLTGDGYALTRSVYAELTGDRYMKNLDFSAAYFLEKIPEEILSATQEDSGIRDAMWIVADMFPSVINLSSCRGLWNITFVVPEDRERVLPNRIYEIAVMPEGAEAGYGAALYDAAMALKNADPAFWDSPQKYTGFRRLVLLHREDALRYIPRGIGIMAAAVLDADSPRHFRLIAKYSAEEAWSEGR